MLMHWSRLLSIHSFGLIHLEPAGMHSSILLPSLHPFIHTPRGSVMVSSSLPFRKLPSICIGSPLNLRLRGGLLMHMHCTGISKYKGLGTGRDEGGAQGKRIVLIHYSTYKVGRLLFISRRSSPSSITKGSSELNDVHCDQLWLEEMN
jgi:hypothetical protein